MYLTEVEIIPQHHRTSRAPLRSKVWELLQREQRIPPVGYMVQELGKHYACITGALLGLAREGKLIRGKKVGGRWTYSFAATKGDSDGVARCV